MKLLVFDMDGTIADLYGVENWLICLRNYDPTPYEIAKPLYDMVALTSILNDLKTQGWEICVTSWLSKETTPLYDKQVRVAKREWLEKNGFPYDYLHLVQYGTTKANCTRQFNYETQILIDDNEKIRKGWTLGDTINPKEELLEKLKYLLTK